MTTWSNILSSNWKSGKQIVSATNAIIEAHPAEKTIRIITRGKLKRLQQESITQQKQCQI